MRTRTFVAAGAALLAAACSGRACGWGGAKAPEGGLPTTTRGDGRTYRVLDKGTWKGYYDAQGRLSVVEYDSNGDGRPDYVAHYDESKQIRLIEVDEDGDAWVDRWEHYGPTGVLEKVGRWRKARGKEDEWTFRGPDGRAVRIEYDDDGDGRPDRAETLREGLVTGVETDTDRDGRMDRWQTWDHGHVTSEVLDTDGDGRPDRRLVFGPGGRLVRVERVTP
jgi:hypothetical protein